MTNHSLLTILVLDNDASCRHGDRQLRRDDLLQLLNEAATTCCSTVLCHLQQKAQINQVLKCKNSEEGESELAVSKNKHMKLSLRLKGTTSTLKYDFLKRMIIKNKAATLAHLIPTACQFKTF